MESSPWVYQTREEKKKRKRTEHRPTQKSWRESVSLLMFPHPPALVMFLVG